MYRRDASPFEFDSGLDSDVDLETLISAALEGQGSVSLDKRQFNLANLFSQLGLGRFAANTNATANANANAGTTANTNTNNGLSSLFGGNSGINDGTALDDTEGRSSALQYCVRSLAMNSAGSARSRRGTASE